MSFQEYGLTKRQQCVLETRVLVSRRLEDKNESFGLGRGLGSCSLGLGLEHLVLVLVSVLEKVLQFLKTLVIILDSSDQGTPWQLVRDNKSSLPFWSRCLREPSALHAHQPKSRGYLTMGLFVRRRRAKMSDNFFVILPLPSVIP